MGLPEVDRTLSELKVDKPPHTPAQPSATGTNPPTQDRSSIEPPNTAARDRDAIEKISMSEIYKKGKQHFKDTHGKEPGIFDKFGIGGSAIFTRAARDPKAALGLLLTSGGALAALAAYEFEQNAKLQRQISIAPQGGGYGG